MISLLLFRSLHSFPVSLFSDGIVGGQRGQREREREKQSVSFTLVIRKPRVTRRRWEATHRPKGNLRDHYLYHTLGQMQMQNIFLSGLRVTMMQYNNIPPVFP